MTFAIGIIMTPVTPATPAEMPQIMEKINATGMPM